MAALYQATFGTIQAMLKAEGCTTSVTRWWKTCGFTTIANGQLVTELRGRHVIAISLQWKDCQPGRSRTLHDAVQGALLWSRQVSAQTLRRTRLVSLPLCRSGRENGHAMCMMSSHIRIYTSTNCFLQEFSGLLRQGKSGTGGLDWIRKSQSPIFHGQLKQFMLLLQHFPTENRRDKDSLDYVT